jgi:quinol monooxygenase YgiN
MRLRIAEFRVRSGQVPKAKRAIQKFVRGIRAHEPGTLVYDAFLKEDGRSFIHTMAFKDAASEAKHRKTEHVMAFVGELYPLCDRKPVFTALRLVAATRKRTS